MRPRSTDSDPDARRWRGQPGRMEVWYTTVTEPDTGTGLWIHNEMVAPPDGGPARRHGWTAVFPPGESPAVARFGPDTGPAAPGGAGDGGPDGDVWFDAGGSRQTSDRLTGGAGDIAWDLTRAGGGPALYTFPRWVWERELLPAAQMVPYPSATYSGTVRVGERVYELRDAPGAGARIYGHGNALRWAWLHADLGGGDICEIVAAVSPRPGLRLLPPLPFLRLRVGDRQWPDTDPVLAAPRLRARIALPTWTVSGRVGDRRIRVRVTQDPSATLALDYADPDGRPSVCRNSERADASIRLERRSGGGWRTEREWHLDGTAHAEVGDRA